jgi:pre-mRNA branch site protein p14
VTEAQEAQRRLFTDLIHRLRICTVLYHVPSRQAAKADLAKREADLEALKQRHNIGDTD